MIDELEDMRKQVLQGIIVVQKRFRGRQARRYFYELKGGVTTLQSFGHGENARRGNDVLVKTWRADIPTQKHMKQQVAPQTPDEGAIIHLQSG
ncbi:Myosin-3 [Vitis vinifera]|uniref:Myosin-3 n=1 Tax=Vitis vinifera TaxID=29760 RepID=A0A438I8P3_VITVI|nr:Myosin-3 [Vitis vinifera]